MRSEGAHPILVSNCAWIDLPDERFGYSRLTPFRNGKNDGYSLIQRAACNASQIAVWKFFHSNAKKRNSRGSLAKYGRRPRCRRPETLLKNQHTVQSKAGPILRKGGKMYLPGIGEVRLARKLDLHDTDMHSFTITRKSGRLSLRVSVFESEPPKKTDGPIIGIDAGVKHALATCYQQDGTNHVGFLDPPENARRHRDGKISKLYSERSRKKRNSRAWQKITKQIQAELKKIADRATDWEHKTTLAIARIARRVGVENLNLVGMNKKKCGVAGSRDLHREMNYSRIGKMQEALEWACAKTGTKYSKNPAEYTSQKCYRCGTIDSRSRENQTDFHCTCCRFAENADCNAAANVAVLASAAAGLAVVRCEDIARLLGLPEKEPPTRGRLPEHQKCYRGQIVLTTSAPRKLTVSLAPR